MKLKCLALVYFYIIHHLSWKSNLQPISPLGAFLLLNFASNAKCELMAASIFNQLDGCPKQHTQLEACRLLLMARLPPNRPVDQYTSDKEPRSTRLTISRPSFKRGGLPDMHFTLPLCAVRTESRIKGHPRWEIKTPLTRAFSLE